MKECYIGRAVYEIYDTMKKRIGIATLKTDDPRVLRAQSVGAYGGLLGHHVQIQLRLWILAFFALFNVFRCIMLVLWRKPND
jgi:hypothetical protein